ncbi:zwei Ig domain protein zig-8-like [Homarus americanus]|uniref:zwei Ig domain protein zig-8-like n=1 Tax=Homarus americanus TaxID=6706 RepID=UPI001C489AD1|nr:zwei Ig domain protein zig-8-like [Homarus americanus]
MGGHGGVGTFTATFTFACCLVAFCVVRGNDTTKPDKTTTGVEQSLSYSRQKEQQRQQMKGLASISLGQVKGLASMSDGQVKGLASMSDGPFISEEESDSVPDGPYFLKNPATLVTVRAGQAASLTCIVKQLGNRQVSWIRGRDLHVLSSGQVTFSSDSRISVSHVKDSWTLTIRYTQPRDAGSYSCQVNTQPLIASWYNLTVVEARANILGKETMYVQFGSTVTLECVIKEELVIPGLVLWYQDDRLVDRDSRRVKVVTQVANVTTSTLTVTTAAQQDSGNYSCWPSSGRPDSVLVHVIQGEPPAAMQHGNSAAWVSTLLLVPATLTSLLFLLT